MEILVLVKKDIFQIIQIFAKVVTTAASLVIKIHKMIVNLATLILIEF